jgi:hypothetical protein
MRGYSYLSRAKVRKYLPLMKKKGVSKVSRRNGFTKIYLSGENPKLLMATKNQSWDQKRHNFLKRHLARGNDLFDRYGEPTRHHLALIAWAYSPSPKVRK